MIPVKDVFSICTGIHLKPHEFHEALASDNSILIDVRNFNETLIGKFVPPGGEIQTTAVVTEEGSEKVLDPCMRRSTDFPTWVNENKHKFEGKQVLMCCTAGVRCERASAFLVTQGIENVYQLEGGIHRYLDAYPDDGGYWKGKNYTFDKRFSHGAKTSEVISVCCVCNEPWARYQAQMKCIKCKMEVLVCKPCQTSKPPPPKHKLVCPLCAIGKCS
jgi:predicted sulfurtransferase